MNCIFLLLLLSCCGGFGNGGTRSGCGCGDNNGTFYADNNFGRSGSSLGNGNNIRTDYNNGDDDCGCQNNGAEASSNFGYGQGYEGAQGADGFSGGPSHWQDYPGIPRRDNCDCDN